ncbi:U3 small nucleolar RNA-associated protein 6 homolog [Homalodisca vitripennis]|uniref:U3 small nucleolar RNA-associated protein 6 homolog n=1 Tax=Homalodisca liturata TaxID=320908 RepID=A0A1B6HLF9_9HEMI|nr:U3 small nucleolar RNA-associated protein 6 homolog [Homalodisca vitripennis]XP_046658518.1 U3 small nucleolar RNA-associated protein 6 homolog [Homalodisca vitripennis]KAG8320343.1 U3 snoRNP protein [Homalodisca vitripennis]
MAEIVELNCEESIPELESMMLLLFEKEEVQAITNQRKDYEYKMHRQAKRKEDCMKYIKYEMLLMKTIKLRQKKKGIQKNAKMTNLEFSLGRRLNKMFILSIRWFPNDIKLWITYIKFCKKMNFFAAASRILEQMLELHGGSRPELFKMAANWELNECNCIEKARKYLMMGLHLHKDSKMLLTEAFRLELIDADRNRKECIEKKLPLDPTNNHLTSRKAEFIYDCSIKKLHDVELMNDLLNICGQYDFAVRLQNKLNTDLFEYESDERMWDIIAQRELNNTEEKLTPKVKIGKCVTLYDTAVKRLNTPKMWAYYLDALLELAKDSSVLPIYKRKLLMTALQRGASAGKLTEKYYLIWVSHLQGPEKHKKLVEVLQGAVKKLPESVTLWHTLLRVHLTKGEEVQASQVFDQGVAALTTQSLPLWKLMLQFEQIKRHNKIEEIFKKSWTQCPEISGPLKPMYLEWLVLTQGIAIARKMYDQMCEMPPPCLEMHKKMVYLESIQPTMNMRRIRQSYTIACAQFGFLDVDVWMDHCKFEINSGDPERVSEIYWRARKNLSPQQFETFLSEFSLIRTVPIPNPTP